MIVDNEEDILVEDLSQRESSPEQSQIIPVTDNAEIPILPVREEDSDGSTQGKPNSAPDGASEQEDEPKIEAQKPKRSKFQTLFLEKHQILGMLCDRYSAVSRAEKLTIILVQLMLELFTIGLFYDNDRTPVLESEDVDDKTME